MSNTKTGNRVLRLLNGDTIFGESEIVHGGLNGDEILIKKPFTSVDGNMGPYMVNIMGSGPGAVQIHPMNIMWSCPLDEFQVANEQYIKATSSLILPD